MAEGGKSLPATADELTLKNKDNGQSVTKKGSEPVDEQADTQPKPIVLEEVDRLKLENIQLKLMNAQSRAMELERSISGFEKGYLKLLSELSQKYGFDPATTELEPGSGRVVPRGTIPR